MPSNSGYPKGVHTQPFVMHNPTDNNATITTANGTRYSLNSLHVTAAWRDALNVTMRTIRAGFITSTNVYVTSPVHTIFVNCTFCTNIDTITLQAESGTPLASLAQNGTQFIINSLCISFEH
jgi:hypothetical protein